MSARFLRVRLQSGASLGREGSRFKYATPGEFLHLLREGHLEVSPTPASRGAVALGGRRGRRPQARGALGRRRRGIGADPTLCIGCQQGEFMERDAGDWSPSPGLPPGRHPLRPPHSSQAQLQALPGPALPVRSPLTSPARPSPPTKATSARVSCVTFSHIFLVVPRVAPGRAACQPRQPRQPPSPPSLPSHSDTWLLSKTKVVSELTLVGIFFLSRFIIQLHLVNIDRGKNNL